MLMPSCQSGLSLLVEGSLIYKSGTSGNAKALKDARKPKNTTTVEVELLLLPF